MDPEPVPPQELPTPSRPITEAQWLYFGLMRLSSFNTFDGQRVVADLLAHRELWEAVVMMETGFPTLATHFEGLAHGLAALGDTLYIRPSSPDAGTALERLAAAWDADEIGWKDEDYAQPDGRRALVVWWD